MTDGTDSEQVVPPGPRKPLMSGHCSTPQTAEPHLSHERCARKGAGQASNPDKEWQPCPCGCHLGETYECGNCGRAIREAPHWYAGLTEDEMTYVHVEASTGQALREECG